jgi:hypothetical protein
VFPLLLQVELLRQSGIVCSLVPRDRPSRRIQRGGHPKRQEARLGVLILLRGRCCGPVVDDDLLAELLRHHPLGQTIHDVDAATRRSSDGKLDDPRQELVSGDEATRTVSMAAAGNAFDATLFISDNSISRLTVPPPDS